MTQKLQKVEIRLKTSPTISFILVPRSVTDIKSANTYFLTFSFLLKTTPSSEVVVLLSQTEFDPFGIFTKLSSKYLDASRIRYVDCIESDEDGVPFIDSWFTSGLDSTRASLVCWINSDIVVPPGWLEGVHAILRHFRSHSGSIMIVGQRIDANFKLLNVSYSDPIDLKRLVFRPRIKAKGACDFFLLVRKNLSFNFDDILPFHMGMYWWDFQVVYLFNEAMPLVHMGPVKVIHINHPHSAYNDYQPKMKENLEMKMMKNDYDLFGDETMYVLVNESTGYRVEKRY